MKAFFSTRLQTHQKKMQRYLKYVFNDHFALTVTLLVGGLSVYYSNLIKSLPTPFPLGALIVGIVWYATLHLGRFASLLEPADKVFLLPKEKQMRDYLGFALRYSSYLPFGLLVLASASMMPLLVVSTKQSFSSFFYYVLMLWGLKFSHLLIQRMALFQDMEKATGNAYCLWRIISVGILALAIFVLPWLGVAISGAQLFLFYNLCWHKMHALIDWDQLIAFEENRLYSMYKLINLFTDVPQIKAQIKRRRYLDFLLKKLSFQSNKTYHYLFARRFLRSSEYSGLYLRVTVLGAVCCYFIQQQWVALGIGGLFLYVIGFQLLPLARQYDYLSITQLYPVKTNQKQQALKWLVGRLLFLTAALFSLIQLIVGLNCIRAIIVCMGYFLVTWVFVQFYLPYRLRKA